MSIVLWEYPEEVIQRINRDGGKLWFLNFLANNTTLANALDDTGVLVWPTTIPMTLNAWIDLSEGMWNDFIDKRTPLLHAKNGLAHLCTKKIMVRWSVPGDYRSLVDVIPTECTHDMSFNGAFSLINSIRAKVSQTNQDIERYAKWTWVPWDKDQLHFGLALEFNVPIITATEDPNQEGTTYIDHWEWKHEYWQTIFANTHSPETPFFEGRSIDKFLSLLRKEWILDRKIAYQLELGRMYSPIPNPQVQHLGVILWNGIRGTRVGSKHMKLIVFFHYFQRGFEAEYLSWSIVQSYL